MKFASGGHTIQRLPVFKAGQTKSFRWLSDPSHFVNTTPDSPWDLNELTAACIEGVRLRGTLAQRLIGKTSPRLALMVFPEIHRVSHQMWHTVEPHHYFYRGRILNGERAPAPLLKYVYRAVDEQIGRLIETAGHSAAVMVFALHGMRPGIGFPTFLGPLLCERNFSRIESWTSQSWSNRVASLLAATKRHIPDGVKKLYYKLTPKAATHKLARPILWPVYDWKNTRAFSLPTDQNGWIRINLIGREAQGCVRQEEYYETCGQLEKLLLGLTTEDGQSLVQDVIRTTTDVESALSNPLPDIVVQWRDAAFASPLRIKGSRVQAEPVGKKSTGQHASEGFCIYKGDRRWDSDVVPAKDLGRLTTAALL